MDIMFKSWLNQTVQIESYVSQDGAGDCSYGTSRNVSCYMYGGGQRFTHDGTHNITQWTSVLCVDGTETVNPKDRVTIGGRKFPVLHVVPYYDDLGNKEFSEVHLDA